MKQEEKDRIQSNFQANITRVKTLVAAYEVLGTPGAGRPSVQQTDVLRSAVVLLHASLEDLIRSSSEQLLPYAAKDILDGIGFPDGPEKTKPKFSLGELQQYRGKSVDDLIRSAVQTRLMRSNYNNVGELAAALERIGLSPNLLDPDQADIDSFMKRRHLIVHRADKNPTRIPGRGVPRTQHINKTSVEKWIRIIDGAGTRIAQALPTP